MKLLPKMMGADYHKFFPFDEELEPDLTRPTEPDTRTDTEIAAEEAREERVTRLM